MLILNREKELFGEIKDNFKIILESLTTPS